MTPRRKTHEHRAWCVHIGPQWARLVIPAADVRFACSVADGDAEQPDHVRDGSVGRR